MRLTQSERSCFCESTLTCLRQREDANATGRQEHAIATARGCYRTNYIHLRQHDDATGTIITLSQHHDATEKIMTLRQHDDEATARRCGSTPIMLTERSCVCDSRMMLMLPERTCFCGNTTMVRFDTKVRRELRPVRLLTHKQKPTDGAAVQSLLFVSSCFNFHRIGAKLRDSTAFWAGMTIPS